MKSIINQRTMRMIAVIISLISVPTLSFAQAEGHGAGNGGDSNELRVREIANDIANWIRNGGSNSLKLPASVTLQDYNTKMLKVLDPQVTVVSFTNQTVLVDGVEKACKNFDAQILCNIGRFQATTESAQYTLVHHEFAGLAGLEVNINASSDYQISNQLTEFLQKTTVLKLGIKKNTPARGPNDLCAADPDAVELFNILDSASTNKLQEVTNFISSRNISLNAQDRNCETPILRAIRNKENDVFEYLFNTYWEPSVNTYSMAGATIYEYGLKYGNMNLISFLRSKGGQLILNRTELMIAAQSNTIDVIRSLIQTGAKINQADSSSGKTALMLSMSNPDLEVFKLLIQSGADLSIHDAKDETVLSYAVENNNLEFLKILIKAGIDLNHLRSGGLGSTALMVAAMDNEKEAAKILIQAGVDLNLEDGIGQTALMKSVKKVDIDILKMLIAAGSDVNHQNQIHETALSIALEFNCQTAAQAIIQAGGH